MRRLALFPCAALVLLAGAAACGSGDDNGTPATTAPSSSAAASSSPSASQTPAIDRTLRVTYADGKATGDTDVTVARGTVLKLIVTSDVADEIHNHATNDMVDVEAGGTATMVFTAKNPGQWQIELEDLGKTLVNLKITG